MRWPSPSLVVSILAMVVACTASATAATLITSKQIKDDTVRSADIRNGSIRSADIRDRTIRGDDLRPGILRPLMSSARQASRASGPRGKAAAAGMTPVVTLAGLEIGGYVVFGKVDLSSNAIAGSFCRLATSSGAADVSGRGLRATGTPEAHNLQLVATFTEPGTAVLECRADTGAWSAQNAKITAIRVGDARNTDMPE